MKEKETPRKGFVYTSIPKLVFIAKRKAYMGIRKLGNEKSQYFRGFRTKEEGKLNTSHHTVLTSLKLSRLTKFRISSFSSKQNSVNSNLIKHQKKWIAWNEHRRRFTPQMSSTFPAVRKMVSLLNLGTYHRQRRDLEISQRDETWW